MQIRRQARIVALQALYEIDLTGHSADTALREHFIQTSMPPVGQIFAERLLRSVLWHRSFLDQCIARHAPEWPIEQLAVIDRNILRMAIFELASGGDVPLKVAINEAVDLAKIFGSDASSRFINGVLGSVVADPKCRTLPDQPGEQVAPEAGEEPPVA